MRLPQRYKQDMGNGITTGELLHFGSLFDERALCGVLAEFGAARLTISRKAVTCARCAARFDAPTRTHRETIADGITARGNTWAVGTGPALEAGPVFQLRAARAWLQGSLL